jgi:hypothetical protein
MRVGAHVWSAGDVCGPPPARSVIEFGIFMFGSPPVPPRLVLTRLPSRACMHALRLLGAHSTPPWMAQLHKAVGQQTTVAALLSLTILLWELGAYHPHARSLCRGRRARILLHLRTQSECTALRSCRLAAFQRPHVAKVANERLRKVHEQTRSVNQ